jgi:hypothetical protein
MKSLPKRAIRAPYGKNENNDYVGRGKRTGLQVNVKFRGSARFLVEKVMGPRKILDK